MSSRIVDAAYLAMVDAQLWTVVVTLGALGNFQTAGLAVAAEVGLAGGIDEVHPVNVHKVVVEAHR